jgi:2-keto-3-deoxy-galactonokinase
VLRDGALVVTLPGTASAWVDAEAGEAARRYEVRAVGGGGEAFGSPAVDVPAVTVSPTR